MVLCDGSSMITDVSSRDILLNMKRKTSFHSFICVYSRSTCSTTFELAVHSSSRAGSSNSNFPFDTSAPAQW